MMTKYQVYKSSNVDFIGDIPKHWEARKLKFIINFQNGYAFKSDLFSDNGINVIRIGDISNSIDCLNCKKSREIDVDKLFKINKQDCLIALSGATTGKTCFVDNSLEDAYINQRVAKFNYKNKFLYYVVISDLFQEMIFLGADGSAQENISTNKLENIDIPLPPINEQEKIANFLDTKNKQIEEFIKDKQNQIALHEEQKEAIINKAVTKGLDDSVEFKDSGIEWIGDIPKSWDIRKLKYITDINQITLTDKVDKNYEIKYIDISNVNTKGLIEEPLSLKFGEAPSRAKRVVLKNDIILSTVRTYLKAIAYLEDVEDNWIASTGFAVLSSKDIIYSQYLYFIILSKYLIEQIAYRSVGVTYPSINISDLGDIKLGLPSKIEQKDIIKYIETETLKIDEVINQIQKEIDLIQEYKISLISEVVTGQIDVR
jgi:type I restriction enzyme S subunit